MWTVGQFTMSLFQLTLTEYYICCAQFVQLRNLKVALNSFESAHAIIANSLTKSDPTHKFNPEPNHNRS